MSNFDGVLDPASGWPDIPQASTSMVVLGGAGGPLNEQATQLTARTKKLKEDIENIPLVGFGGQYKNLVVTVSGVGYQGAITADRLVVESGDFKAKVLRNINVAFNGVNNGANGLDADSVVAGNWYYLFVIYNPTTDTTASLISLSSTAPTLPSGYTKLARVGAAYVKAATTAFRETKQTGNIALFGAGTIQAFETLVSAGTSTTHVAVSTATTAPPTASEVHIHTASTSGVCSVYPDNSVGLPYFAGTGTLVVGGFVVEKTAGTFYYRMSAIGEGYVRTFGYKDNL